MTKLKNFLSTYKTKIIGATIEAIIIVSLNHLLPPAINEATAQIVSLAIMLTH
ncbi:hypothetical protein [Pseudomonas sp. NFACC02]|uniref:hypothetical protein n=1 Tax=Pseudomonas sp. NFACC02 TaxID=1566250 RepID=UPI001587124A|nr:hypothetical protein [Pseudomonas sp. NFACC02]